MDDTILNTLPTQSALASMGLMAEDDDGHIQEGELIPLYNLRGTGDAFLKRIKDKLGIALPQVPNTICDDALWLGPDEWLVMKECPSYTDVFDGKMHGSLTDVSDNYSHLILESKRAEARLQKVIAMDLRESQFAVGTCVQTIAMHVPVILWRQEKQKFTLFTRRSYAKTLWAILEG